MKGLLRGPVVDPKAVESTLACAAPPHPAQLREILAKACALGGLTLPEAAALLCVEEPHHRAEVLDAAFRLKQAVFGRSVVLFATLCLSRDGATACPRCGAPRSPPGGPVNGPGPLQPTGEEEVRAIGEELLRMGHRRLLLVADEDPEPVTLDSLERLIAVLHGVSFGSNRLRRFHVQVPPLSTEGLRRLRGTGIGVCQVHPQTYHFPTHRCLRPDASAAGFEWVLEAPDRAHEAGIEDVGLGVLFGHWNPRWETLALIAHADHLRSRWGRGPHAVSVARAARAARPSAMGRPGRVRNPHAVSDSEFLRLIAVIRLALPMSSVVLATPVEPTLRRKGLSAGVSQLSAGVFHASEGVRRAERSSSARRHGADAPCLEALMTELLAMGAIPSLCTACHRLGRTGGDLVSLTERAAIRDLCQPNALLSLAEYLEDFASKETRVLGRRVIEDHLSDIPDPKVLAKTLDRLAQIHAGRRDLQF